MSAALLDDLLAGYTAPVRLALATPTPANPANPAKNEHPCGFAGASGTANGLRVSANPAQPETDATPDSQGFAAFRKPQTGPQSQHSCGSSRDSQDSQGFPPQSAAAEGPDLAAVAWTDGDIAAFLARRARLMRWGWPAAYAEGLAERLVNRDREGDEGRVTCVDCKHYRPHRCGNHRRAGLFTQDIAHDLATLPQRCPGFEL